MIDGRESPAPRLLEPRLALLLLLQFSIPGAWIPVIPPYLSGSLGFSPWEVGLLLAVPGVGAFLAPWISGQLADRHMPAERLMAFLSMATAASLVGFAVSRSFASMLVWIGLQGLTFSPTISLANAICLTHLPRPEVSFGRVRLWGTVGWILGGIAVGQWLLHEHSPGLDEASVRAAQDAGRVDGVWLAAWLSVVSSLYTLLVIPRTPPPAEPLQWNAVSEAWAAFRSRPLLGLFAAGLFASCIDRFYLYHGAARLSEYGVGPPDWIDRVFGVGGGGLMTLGQLAEIAVLALLPLLLRRFSIRTLLSFGLWAFLVRMIVLATCESLLPVLGAVSLHGVSYASFFFVGTLAVDRLAPRDARASAQALFLTVYAGFGGIVGAGLAAWAGAWAGSGGSDPWLLVFSIPSGMAVLALLAFRWGWPHHERSA